MNSNNENKNRKRTFEEIDSNNNKNNKTNAQLITTTPNKKYIANVNNEKSVQNIYKQSASVVNDREDEKSPKPDQGGLIIRPFRGFHPPSKLMREVASPPYDVINTDEARESARNNPKSFLHVNKPQIEFEKKENIDQYNDCVYEMGFKKLNEFCNNKWLIQDERPSFYIYSQKMGDHLQYGIVCECSSIQYEQDIIKKHELTRKIKENDRTKLTDIQSANVGPIFLCYKAVSEIDKLIAECINSSKKGNNNKPFSEFTSDDNIEHKLWIIDCNTTVTRLSKLFQEKVPFGYVADGHHRTASAWRVYKKRRAELEKQGKYTGNESFHYFLAVLFPHDQLKILDYNRVLGDFGDIHKNNKKDFLKDLKKNWNFVKCNMTGDDNKVPKKPDKHNDFRMYIANDGWYDLHLKSDLFNEIQNENDVVRSLDVSILSEFLLEPIMGVKDIRNHRNISFVGGIHGLTALKDKVDANENGVAFALFPTSIDQLISVADAKKLMPPKSTWFEPKLRSGVVVRRF